MFETPKDFKYDEYVRDTTREYKIAPNDLVSFRLYPNNGQQLINISDDNLQRIQQLNQGVNYLVEFDGNINLPLIGRVQIGGMTLREAEFFFETKYSELFNDPFVLLNLINRRVTIFPGSGGDGAVITLTNNNVKLLEALALAGGIADDGRAKRIKLIRGDLSDPQVFLIDLSTIEGISQADIILQANDIIYVEPIGVTTRQVLSEISPILGLFTSIITLYFVIDRLD
ncbi:MAG: polysaccharide biosynthesis/export family protein [Flavobacteriales bacterium]|nr:polysaccharide biosynthesis/export family protein [Flavobacteriales bacterium]